MRAVMLEVPEALVEERRRLGIDGRDEMWEGVLHMVPPPFDRLQRLEAKLLLALAPPAQRLGLVTTVETGVFRADNDYRVPDLVISRSEDRSERGIEGRAELVIEIRSPNDETYQKIDWYLSVGVREVVVIDRDTLGVTRFGSNGALAVTFETLEGPRLRLTWDGGQEEISV